MATMDFDVGTPGTPKYRTPLGYRGSAPGGMLTLLHQRRPTSDALGLEALPAYAGLVAVIIKTGLRHLVITERYPGPTMRRLADAALTAPTYLTGTLSLDPVDYRAAPLQQDVLGTLGMVERPVARVVLPNPDGWWHRLVTREALLRMPGGVFWVVDDRHAIPLVTGVVGEIRLERARVELAIGLFPTESEDL